jgi:hypothetical protein
MIKSNISIANADIGFRNFSGKLGRFNPEGQRNFCVFLDDNLSAKLEDDGWNVRWLTPKDDGAPKQGYLQVKVAYDNTPPKILIISSKGKTLMDEESVSIIDWADIAKIDLVICPYNWTMHKGTPNEKSGVKAYVKAMYITIAEDEFEKQYYDAPDSAVDSIGGCGNCEACDGSCKHHD